MTEPLLLVPGLQSEASSWLLLLERVGRHLPFVVPRGHQFAPTISDMAQSVIRQAPDRFHLVGWSMGGYIAFEILRQCPERLQSLILIATTEAPESVASRQGRGEALERARTEGLRGYQIANLKRCLFAPEDHPPEVLEALISSSASLGLEAFTSQICAIMSRPDSMPALKTCPCPVLIIAGKEDAVISVENSRRMHEIAAGSTLHEIPECGHCPPIEEPDLVSDIIVNWITSTEQVVRAKSDMLDVASEFIEPSVRRQVN